jgi:hypothetical protein
LLTPQGKFLHDFFITERDSTLWIDCEGGARAEDLKKRFMIYKLRAKVTIECIADAPAYGIINADKAPDTGFKDPRHNAMGHKSYIKPENIGEQPFEHWDAWRIKHTVPDGSRDMQPEFSTLMDCNIDTLNGISFEKGCFIGQELTARMNYRGLVKKRLRSGVLTNDNQMVVRENDTDTTFTISDDRTVMTMENKKAGDLRSSAGGFAIAMVKNDALKA